MSWKKFFGQRGETRSEKKEEEPAPDIVATREGPQGQTADGESRKGVLARLKEGLARTRSGFVARVDKLLSRYKTIDEDLLEELEELLIQADVGVETTVRLIDNLRQTAKEKGISDAAAVRPLLQEQVREILSQHSAPLCLSDDKPAVILMVGVNGSGKTTTIGKLAHRFRAEGKKVLLGAGDTFRAAAIEQLEIWAERVGADIIKHQPGADPAAVAFDTIQAGRSRQYDVLIIDTAGRLQTKTNLMRELAKVGRVIERELGRKPDEVLLVVDATTGQNALSQARLFQEAVDVSGVVLTKLDGTAKGGIIVAIASELGLPVKLIGIGEGYLDLRDFNAEDFVTALFE